MTHDASPAMAEHLMSLGRAYAARGEYQGALACFEQARVMRPLEPQPHIHLGATLARMNRLSDALLCYQEASRLDPDNAGIRHSLGSVLERLHRLEDAVACYRQAVTLNPQADVSFNNMASALHALGRFPEAHEAYRQAIHFAPENTTYYRNFVQSKKLTADDPCFIAMEKLLRRAASLTPESQAELHFAFGHALADLGQDDLSFEHILKANALKRRCVTYDEAVTLDLFERIPALQDANLLREKHGMGDPADTPVFIVGMPRSGSTLVEQILASHPQVFGAGESPAFLQALSARVARPEGDLGKIDVAALESVPPAQWASLGADYLRRLRATIEDARRYRRITDKYPFNFIHLGLIHLALPGARVIHIRRSPLDTCLSNFSRIFRDVPFSYDLGELGRYYRAYDTLMAHWRVALPQGTMLEVQYEELVSDLEPNVRRILAHCGLEWDERCLAFHQTKRQVVTASASQVRRPLFRTSLERWRPPPAMLQPLLDGLGPGLSGRQ
jgi:tetratricopeptide (TPR) repeat protein